jgi:hypothetical protein
MPIKKNDSLIDKGNDFQLIWFNFYKNTSNMFMNVSLKDEAEKLPEYVIKYNSINMEIVEAPKEE